MTLLSTLNDDMKQAMKAKEKDVLQVIRMIKASLQNEQIKLGRELTEEEDLTILAREMKQRRDSLAEFEKAHRDDFQHHRARFHRGHGQNCQPGARRRSR